MRAFLVGGEHGRHREHAGERLDRLLARLAQGFLALAVPGVDLDGEKYTAVLDGEAGDHAELDHALAAVVVDDGGERLDNLIFADLRHCAGPSVMTSYAFLAAVALDNHDSIARAVTPARCTIKSAILYRA